MGRAGPRTGQTGQAQAAIGDADPGRPVAAGQHHHVLSIDTRPAPARPAAAPGTTIYLVRPPPPPPMRAPPPRAPPPPPMRSPPPLALGVVTGRWLFAVR